MAKEEFEPIVQKALGYYVYALVNPEDKRIFYIGKGKGNRVFQHVKGCATEDGQSLKLETIRDIIQKGKEVSYYILRHNMTEETAYIVESTLIDLLTYKGFNKDNILTNIVRGHHQWDEGIKTVEEIEMLYNCPKIIPKHNLLLVSLNKSYNQKNASGVYRRDSDYERTRKYWNVSPQKIGTNQIDYVLGVYEGIVRTVYKPTRWIKYEVADNGTQFKRPRYGFEGDSVQDSPYLNTDVTEYPFGRGGAIRYIYART